MWMAYCLVPYQNRGPNTATDLAVVNRTSLRSRPLPCTDQASVCDYQVNKCKRGICEEQSHIKTLCHNSNSLKETHQRKKTSESKNISNVNSGCPVSSNQTTMIKVITAKEKRHFSVSSLTFNIFAWIFCLFCCCVLRHGFPLQSRMVSKA